MGLRVKVRWVLWWLTVGVGQSIRLTVALDDHTRPLTCLMIPRMRVTRTTPIGRVNVIENIPLHGMVRPTTSNAALLSWAWKLKSLIPQGWPWSTTTATPRPWSFPTWPTHWINLWTWSLKSLAVNTPASFAP